MHDLIQVTFGEREFSLSPLRLGVLRHAKLLEDFRVVFTIRKGKFPGDAEMDSIVNILYAAAHKTQPFLTRELFDEALEELHPLAGVTQIIDAFSRLMIGSGFVQHDVTKDALGEEGSSQTLTSPDSTDSSLPQPAGLTTLLTS